MDNPDNQVLLALFRQECWHQSAGIGSAAMLLISALARVLARHRPVAAILLRDLVTGLYDKLGPNFKSQKVVGQLCDTPILYRYENSPIWRPCSTDETGTQAWRFEIVAAGADAYDRELPLKIPALSIREEFPVVRAKRRPVILIKLADVAPATETGSLAAIKALPMVILLYGVVDDMGRQKLPGDFLERAQRLEFPEFFFLPADRAAVKEDSLVPLNRMTHAFEGHLDARQWKLSDSLFALLTGQITFLAHRLLWW